MGGVGREGHECEAEVHGADVELELVKGLEEHGRLDVPDGPAHLNEAHVQDPNDDDDDVPPSRPMQWRRRPRRRLMMLTAGIRTAEGAPLDLPQWHQESRADGTTAGGDGVGNRNWSFKNNFSNGCYNY